MAVAFTGIASQLARSVRAHRLARGLSLGELARRSGLSKTSLSNLESGVGNPSLETLWRLAHALDVSLGALLGETDPPRMFVVRAGGGTPVESESGLRGRLLVAEGSNRRTEVLEMELAPGVAYRSEAHAPGTEEFLVCTEGSLSAGPVDHEVELGSRDALRFPADGPHRYESEHGARALLVMSYSPALGLER